MRGAPQSMRSSRTPARRASRRPTATEVGRTRRGCEMAVATAAGEIRDHRRPPPPVADGAAPASGTTVRRSAHRQPRPPRTLGMPPVERQSRRTRALGWSIAVQCRSRPLHATQRARRGHSRAQKGQPWEAGGTTPRSLRSHISHSDVHPPPPRSNEDTLMRTPQSGDTLRLRATRPTSRWIQAPSRSRRDHRRSLWTRAAA